ncbi:tripartite tricarboxylate transporter TctB family protein [Aurantimonas sp. A2-1-M11]|uniref:tripartite tricarboxylate transporter TctB family protein n=1 Tax=Aurantimonas sp. A2-1-M11 TaxID=3113712 RepID=UPI002F9246B5
MLKVSDLGSGLAVAGLGLAVFLRAQTFPSVGASSVSPAFYPGLIGVVLMGSGAGLAITGAKREGAWLLRAMPVWMRRRENLVAVLAVPAAIIGYGLLSPVLGFLATVFLVTLSLLIAYRVKLLRSAVVAFTLSVLLHIVFVVAMRVPLPYGFVERLLP